MHILESAAFTNLASARPTSIRANVLTVQQPVARRSTIFWNPVRILSGLYLVIGTLGRFIWDGGTQKAAHVLHRAGD